MDVSLRKERGYRIKVRFCKKDYPVESGSGREKVKAARKSIARGWTKNSIPNRRLIPRFNHLETIKNHREERRREYETRSRNFSRKAQRTRTPEQYPRLENIFLRRKTLRSECYISDSSRNWLAILRFVRVAVEDNKEGPVENLFLANSGVVKSTERHDGALDHKYKHE